MSIRPERDTQALDLSPRLALEALRVTLEDVTAANATPPRWTPAAGRLQQITEALGQPKAARPVTCPEDYRRHWDEFVAGTRSEPDDRAIRYLCWESGVAISQPFHTLLTRRRFELRARSLQGLVRSCHMRWAAVGGQTGGMLDFVRTSLRAYRGPNRVLRRWQENDDLLFSSTRFAEDLLGSELTVHEFCAQWPVDMQSEFVGAALETAAQRLTRAKTPRLPIGAVRRVIFWEGWSPALFKKTIDALLLLPDLEQRIDMDELKVLVLDDERLGDPRLPRCEAKWLGIADEARERMIRWLSAEDIEFFFEHVLRKGRDEHGRKPFWLKYLNKVKRSRPLLAIEDRKRLQTLQMQKRLRAGSFGRMNHATTSAFLLDFGNLLVVEFSESGNACYCFGPTLAKRIVPNFWTQEALNLLDLKPTSLVPELTNDTVGDRRYTQGFRFRHKGTWEPKARNQLAVLGVRPR